MIFEPPWDAHSVFAECKQWQWMYFASSFQMAGAEVQARLKALQAPHGPATWPVRLIRSAGSASCIQHEGWRPECPRGCVELRDRILFLGIHVFKSLVISSTLKLLSRLCRQADSVVLSLPGHDRSRCLGKHACIVMNLLISSLSVGLLVFHSWSQESLLQAANFLVY
jgi:hypothetical protein